MRTDRQLEIAHLYRRAGFGLRPAELEKATAKGFEACVEELLHPEQVQDPLDERLAQIEGELFDLTVLEDAQAWWLYRMIESRRPLLEKLTLFWHGHFATGASKVERAQLMVQQNRTLRAGALGRFADLLTAVSKDPAMLVWLDNGLSTKKRPNENYGRELLELFSMGIGNYSEDDVKNCARAFTGWGLQNLLNLGPFGRNAWEFKFYPEQHDYEEKEFLGERGNFDGGDVIDIIVRQPATARFIAMRLYLFFVDDEVDEAAVEQLAEVYQRSGYNTREVVRALLLSDFFRSEAAYYAKVKSPAEHVAGILKLVGDWHFPSWGIVPVALECRYMGQDLMNPPSVEGWHTGREWIDTGILVERINFAAEQVADPTKPGVQAIIKRLGAAGQLSPEELVDRTLDLVGPLPLQPVTRTTLVNHVSKEGPLNFSDADAADQRVTELLQLIVATREFQFC
jgi:uncharacterized protein (DUF1800 family)